MVESENDLDLIRRSKYVQSMVENSFKCCKAMLDKGKWVLFCGTPCQIKALNLYLPGNKYERLVTVDFICHGTPSQSVFHDFLQSTALRNDCGMDQIHNINFRDKTIKEYYPFGFSYFIGKNKILESPQNNPYLIAYLNNTILQENCFCCPARKLKSGSDYILADFWTANTVLPDFSNKSERPSLIYVCNDKLDISRHWSVHRFQELPLDKVRNELLCFSPRKTMEWESFFNERAEGRTDIIALMKKYSRLSKKTRLLNRFYYHFIRKIMQFINIGGQNS